MGTGKFGLMRTPVDLDSAVKSDSDIEAYLATLLGASRGGRVERDHAETMVRYLEDAVESAELLIRQSSSESMRQLGQSIALSHRRTLERLRAAIETPAREACTGQ